MHSHVSSARLVSLLADSAPAAGSEAPAADFAEGLAAWLGALDAVRLREALQAIGPPAPANPGAAPAGGTAALVQALQRVRKTLADGIIADGPGLPGDPAGSARPAAGSAQPAGNAAALAASDNSPDYAPYRRRHLEHQRRMESRIGALRGQVREALTAATPRLAQLAALDAAMAQAFAEREQRLLATLPALLERRFEHLRDAHRGALQGEVPADDPAAGRRPGGWPDAFERAWQQVLLAELELRLQPVAGMIEAFSREDTQCH